MMKALQMRGEQMAEKIGIVVSQFNYEITGEMSLKAQQRAQELGVEVAKVIENFTSQRLT